MKFKHFSERILSLKAKISRSTIRSLAQNDTSVTLKSIQTVVSAMGYDLTVLIHPIQMNSDFSTIAVSMNVIRDGPLSWKTHFMNFVDEFRRTQDPRLILLEPSQELTLKLKGLLASIVTTLCYEAQIDTPAWALKRYDLEEPWFVSEIEKLKAMAILESPLAFRRNNIFVHSNFLERV